MKRRVAIVLCSLTIAPCFGHGGALDSNGGHHDRKHGTYHVHARHSDPPPDEPTPPPPPPAPPASRSDSRSKARTTARTSARDTSRDNARFESSGTMYRDGFGSVVDPSAQPPIEDLTSPAPQTPPGKEVPERFRPRVWTDSKQQFTITAKYTGIRGEKDVLLTTETKKLLQVPISKLSPNDQEWLKKNVKR